jgi:hypothetical protein
MSIIILSSDDVTDPHVDADDIVIQGIMGMDRVTGEEAHLENLIWPERSAKAIQVCKHQKQAGDIPNTVEDLRDKLMDLASKNQLLKQIGRYAGNLPRHQNFGKVENMSF